jgi:hypothetical protein
MSLHVHIANIVNDAYKRLGFVMINSKCSDILGLLFNKIVRRNPSSGILHINHTKINIYIYIYIKYLPIKIIYHI